MEKTVRILILEDVEAEAKLIRNEIKNSGIPAQTQHVRTRKDFLKQLEAFKPDLVLSDYLLPDLGGLSAMDMAREKDPNLPFIFVSWEIHEESVMEVLKKGATDYVFKEQLSRLPLSVRRALHEAEERKEIERVHTEIQRSEEYFRSLIENAMDIITVLDSHGVINYASPSVKKVLGYAPEELVGKNILEFIHPEDAGNATYVFTEADIKAEISTEFRFKHKNGDWRGLEAIGKIVADGSGEARTIVNSRDITDRILEQEALKESIFRHLKTQTELQKTQQKVIKQERLAAIGQMASGIAHDFSNALMPVLGFSEILLNNPAYLNDKEREKARKFLEMINTSARDAMTIVGRLREFYRKKDKTENLVSVNLNEIVKQAVMLTQPKWKDEVQAKGITIQTEADLEDLPNIIGNEAALREVFTNLIFNAVDAMPKGGKISFRSRRENKEVVLEISDTGIGMSEEVRSRCFEPFFSTKGKSGTGLGLAMVYGVIRRHEGTIDVRSQSEKGTTFVIRLPWKKMVAGTQEKVEKIDVHAIPKLRVLVVDDEPIVLEVLKTYLFGDGHEVEVASDGREALEKFHRGKFDLVITDRAMPEVNGDQLAVEIKQISPEIPLIMLTGFGELMKAKDECPEGVDIILSKPLTLEVCRRTLFKVFSSRRP